MSAEYTVSSTSTDKMFDSHIPQELLESCSVRRAVNANSAAWSYDMEGHATKNIDQLCEVSTLCIDDHQFEPEELEAVGEVSQVCSQIVLKCFYLTRIGRLGVRWSVNKLERAVTKWTRACGKRLALFDFGHSIHEEFQAVLSCEKRW